MGKLRKLRKRKRRAELQEGRPKSIVVGKNVQPLNPLLEHPFAANQLTIVRDRAGELETKPKPRRGLLAPLQKTLSRRHRIESAVSFHRGKHAGIPSQSVTRRAPFRINRAAPMATAPDRTTDAIRPAIPVDRSERRYCDPSRTLSHGSRSTVTTPL